MGLLQNSSEGVGNATNLSYSLDKGLDEFGEKKKAEESKMMKSGLAALTVTASTMSHVGSEPILSASSWRKVKEGEEHMSDGDHNFDRDSRTTIKSNKSEFELVTERIAQLVVDSKRTIDDESLTKRDARERSCSDSRESVPLREATERCKQRSCSASGDSWTAPREETREESLSPLDAVPRGESPERCRERSCSDSEAIGVGNGTWGTSPSRPGLSNEQVKCNEPVTDSVFANVTSRTEALASHSTSFNLVGGRHNNPS